MFKTYGTLADNLSFGTPCYWKIQHDPSTISIIPNPKTWRYVVITLVLTNLLLATAMTVLFTMFWESTLMIFVLLGPPIMAVISIIIVAMIKSELNRGDILIWDLPQGRIELPREKLTLQQSQILQIEFISGWWNKDGKKLNNDGDCTQLQLIAQIDNNIRIFPLIASPGNLNLDKEAQTLTARLPVPVFRIRQNVGFFGQRKEDSIEQL